MLTFFLFREILFSISFMLSLILLIAYFTLFERKVMSSMQARNGPDKTGIFGLFQPIADALKLVCKEFIFPQISNSFLFIFAPYLTLVLSLAAMVFIPFSSAGAILNSQFSLL